MLWWCGDGMKMVVVVVGGVCFETRSHCVTQAGLEPPVLTSLVLDNRHVPLSLTQRSFQKPS